MHLSRPLRETVNNNEKEEEKEQEKKKVRLKTKGHENKERVLANKCPRRAQLISTACIALVDGEAS